MNFLITQYVYPLQHNISLSRKPRVTLDNPRTDEEIDAVAKFLEASNTVESAAIRIAVFSDENSLSIEHILHDFRTKYAPRDPYVKMFCQSYARDHVYHFLAGMWVVARYDDEYEYPLLEHEHEEMQRSGQVAMVLLGDEHPIVKNSHLLMDYSALLSLLLHTEGDYYFGRGLLLDHSYQREHYGQQSSRFAFQQFLTFGMACNTPDERMIDEDLRWVIFPYIKDALIRTAEAVDATLLADDRRARIMTIANLLKAVSHDVHDDRMKLIALMSIVDSLLGDDAISKMSTLLHAHDTTRDVRTAYAHIENIWQIRDGLVYGKFDQVSEILNVIPREDEEEDDVLVLQRLISNVYGYLRVILTAYMRDKNFGMLLM